MVYRVVILARANKDLERVPERFKGRVLAAIVALGNDPFLGKKLEGEYAGLWSYRLWPYRILYEIKKREVTVLIVKIGHRQGVYGP